MRALESLGGCRFALQNVSDELVQNGAGNSRITGSIDWSISCGTMRKIVRINDLVFDISALDQSELNSLLEALTKKIGEDDAEQQVRYYESEVYIKSFQYNGRYIVLCVESVTVPLRQFHLVYEDEECTYHVPFDLSYALQQIEEFFDSLGIGKAKARAMVPEALDFKIYCGSSALRLTREEEVAGRRAEGYADFSSDWEEDQGKAKKSTVISVRLPLDLKNREMIYDGVPLLFIETSARSRNSSGEERCLEFDPKTSYLLLNGRFDPMDKHFCRGDFFSFFDELFDYILEEIKK